MDSCDLGRAFRLLGVLHPVDRGAYITLELPISVATESAWLGKSLAAANLRLLCVDGQSLFPVYAASGGLQGTCLLYVIR